MSSQQDIYAAGSKNRPPMLNKENYVPWSSRLLRYAKIRPNGKLIHNFIINGPYVRRMIPEPGDPNREVPVNETFHVQTDDELTEKELKQIEADDQAIQTILLGLPEDIYAAVDSCETAQEIWLHVQQMMKGSDIGIQEKKAKTQDPLALMETSNNPYTFPVLHQDQPSFNQNYMQQPMPNPKDITDPTTAMNIALALMAKAFKLNYSTPTNNNQRISSNPCNRQIAQPGMNMGQDRQMQMVGDNGGNQFSRNANLNSDGNGNLVAARAEGNATGHNDLDEIEEVNANSILMANLQQASTSGAQTDKAPVYDSDGSVEVRNHKDCYDNEIFNMFTQEEQYNELLEPIPEPHQVPQNDNNVISEVSHVEQSGGTVEHPANVEETRVLYDSLYNNLANEVEKVNTVNRKLRETNAELTNELARYKNQEKCFEIKETLQLAQESRQKMKQLNKEIKPVNYTKINNLSEVFVSQMAKSREELYFSNTSKTANVSKLISIPNEEFLDDTTLSVARKFLNEVKSTIVTLQRVVKQRMTLDTHNRSSSAHQELHKIEKDEIFSIINQVDARVQNFEIQFLKEATKFVGDFKSLVKEADESLAKYKALEFEIERLLRAVGRQDIMSVMQNNSVDETSNLQTDLERTKERFENYIIKKENEYAKLWNDWYKKCEECKFDKISYDKAYNDMQQKIERLQAQLEDLKGKSKDTSCVSGTLNPLSQKHKNENVELEFQVLNYAKENAHLKTTYKNLFDSISVTRTQTKTIIDSLQNKLHHTIYENAKLRASYSIRFLIKRTPHVARVRIQSLQSNQCETHALSKPVTSNSIPIPQGSKVVINVKVIALGMFRINPFKPSREEKHVPNKVRASIRTNSITVSQPPVVTKKVVNSDSNGLSSTGVDNTKTRRPQPRSNTKNNRVHSASKSTCSKNKEVDVTIGNYCFLEKRNICHLNANVSINVNQKKQKSKVKKPKKVGSIERLASPKPSKPRSFLRWSPTGRLFDLKGKIIASRESESQSDCSKGDNTCTSNPLEPTIKRFPNSTFSLAGTVRFENDHITAILGFGDLHWGNILITRVYFVEGLGHNLFSVGQFCDSDLEVAFRRNVCFVRNLEGVDLLSGNRTTNLYTINLHEMAYASLICLMARATSTKLWLWHQRLSHLNFDTINDLVKNDLVSDLPKFKYHKEHLCPSCEQGKSKRASHPPKPVLNSRQRLHLLHMDLCGLMRIASINGKRYVLVIVDDYSRYTWVHFLRSKDEAPEVIKTFLKRISILLQSPVIVIRTENVTEFKNQVLKEYFDSVGISHQVSSVRTP
nr:hypothetical protein [Tanacetum cinerariifolium]